MGIPGADLCKACMARLEPAQPEGLSEANDLSCSEESWGDGYADLYEARKSKLGPDPLREDADAEVVWARVQSSRKPIGQLLMDQDAVAGLGNIYRAEVLFKVSLGCCSL